MPKTLNDSPKKIEEVANDLHDRVYQLWHKRHEVDGEAYSGDLSTLKDVVSMLMDIVRQNGTCVLCNSD